MVHSLHYLARLSIIEKGFHPEVTVWNQVRRIEPEIYKLYQELIESGEPTDKRVHLMILAVEHAISKRSRVQRSTFNHLMKESEEPWSFGDLKVHPGLRNIRSTYLQ